MQYFYSKYSKDEEIILQNEDYRYLAKVKRHKVGDKIYFRNLTDDIIYLYEINQITKKEIYCKLLSYKKSITIPSKYIHIGWGIIDPKNIEKTLPSLNELGVRKLSFIYTKYSQRNFKINLEKLDKILINSSMQCGRSDKMIFEVFNSLDEFIVSYPDSFMFNFSQNNIKDKIPQIKTIVVGCEGGFSKDEIDLFAQDKIVGIDTNMILKSQTAITFIVSHLI